jgi:membrane protease YdiL (CAAX protease family)
MTMRNRLANALRNPALKFFAVIWLISLVVLLANGYGQRLTGLLPFVIGELVLAGITLLVFAPALDSSIPYGKRGRITGQLLVIALIIILTALDGLQFHNVFSGTVPLWTDLRQTLEQLGGQLLGNDNYIANPVLYFVIPFILLLALRARPRELGLGRGRNVIRVTLLWCTIPAALLVFVLVSGQVALSRVISRLISNALQNGFFEEFLFRGALQTRLQKFMTPSWSLVIQALLFGLWHIGLGMSEFGAQGWLTAAASTILIQGTFGLAMGVIFARSGNLLAGSLFHVLSNTFGQL